MTTRTLHSAQNSKHWSVTMFKILFNFLLYSNNAKIKIHL